jgi:hypothetical protein
MGGKGETITSPTGAAPQMTGYEPSVSSDSDSPPSSNDPPPPMEVPLAAIPQASTGKKNPWSKASSIPPNALSALPRPKNNLRSSNSTFVTRLQAADNLPKLMAERGKAGGELVRWGFWNLGRTFGWGEEGGKVKVGTRVGVVNRSGLTAPRCDADEPRRSLWQESPSPRSLPRMPSRRSRRAPNGSTSWLDSHPAISSGSTSSSADTLGSTRA